MKYVISIIISLLIFIFVIIIGSFGIFTKERIASYRSFLNLTIVTNNNDKIRICSLCRPSSYEKIKRYTINSTNINNIEYKILSLFYTDPKKYKDTPIRYSVYDAISIELTNYTNTRWLYNDSNELTLIPIASTNGLMNSMVFIDDIHFRVELFNWFLNNNYIMTSPKLEKEDIYPKLGASFKKLFFNNDEDKEGQ